MQKTYIKPQTIVELAGCEMLIAASMLDINNGDSQSITFTDDEYDGEFSVKEYTFGEDF